MIYCFPYFANSSEFARRRVNEGYYQPEWFQHFAREEELQRDLLARRWQPLQAMRSARREPALAQLSALGSKRLASRFTASISSRSFSRVEYQ